MSESKLTKAARGQSCVRCNAMDDTGADLCSECHRFFDEYRSEVSEGWKVARSEEFLAACLLTVIRRIQQGILKV